MRFQGDENEEYNEEEVATMMHKLDKNNLLQALAATRFYFVDLQYAKTQTWYNEPP